MRFLRVNVTFYDVVNVIHDVITTANQIPYIAKVCLSEVETVKLNKSDVER